MAKRSGLLPKTNAQNICGPQIRALRKLALGERGRYMSLEEMASRVQEIYGVSMSAAQLSKIETQKKHVLDIQLIAIARVLEVPVASLFPPEEEHDPQK